ncbi:SPOR domain-containing protein [Bacteroides sp. AN502(2024)]|uniref:SPOR domain-containing protein n=1 Tax=Bacteroides sp. AN502(2024) TaxID=3160599 RepID=UPI003519D24E
MRDFSFYKPEDNDSSEIESIIRQRRRKIARQQLIYTIILLIIVSLICVWLYRKTVYAEFDGYVALDITEFRSDEDIYFLRANVRVGDLVLPGDTLFSYTIAANFFDHTHNDYEPAIVARNRDIKVQYGLARQDIEVLKVRIAELEKQLATEDHNIRFGLSDNHNKLRTEQELAEAREQYKALRRKLGVLWNAVSQSNKSLSKLNNNGHGYVRIVHMYDYELLQKLGLVYYSVAMDSALVTKKYVPASSLTLRGEPIMSLQSLNARDNNLIVVAYVLPDDMKYVNYHSKAEIIVNDEISYTGTVMMLGARTEEIPGELRNTLSRDHTAAIVIFDIDPNQDIPYWSLSDGVPVRIRINKFKDREPIVGDYIIYNTTTGVYPETLMHAQHKCSKDGDHVVLVHHHDSVHTDKDSVRTVAPDSTVVKNKTPVTHPSDFVASGNATGPYHIIVASGQDKSGAERQVKMLRLRGYKYAKVFSADGYHRVSLCSYATKAEAENAQKQLIKQKEFGNAWILCKRIR